MTKLHVYLNFAGSAESMGEQITPGNDVYVSAHPASREAAKAGLTAARISRRRRSPPLRPGGRDEHRP